MNMQEKIQVPKCHTWKVIKNFVGTIAENGVTVKRFQMC
jgi:hypothetical protein